MGGGGGGGELITGILRYVFSIQNEESREDHKT